MAFHLAFARLHLLLSLVFFDPALSQCACNTLLLNTNGSLAAASRHLRRHPPSPAASVRSVPDAARRKGRAARSSALGRLVTDRPKAWEGRRPVQQESTASGKPTTDMRPGLRCCADDLAPPLPQSDCVLVGQDSSRFEARPGARPQPGE